MQQIKIENFYSKCHFPSENLFIYFARLNYINKDFRSK